MSEYSAGEIEPRWQKRWTEARTFEVTEDTHRPKYYCLEMLPYPSGDIHVGHVRNYCITDVVARYKRMRGFNVMHPIGWDALGLPAENAAIKRGVHPEKWTRENIAGMKRQLQRLGFSYPWSREVATCDPEYYHWNQWFFVRMFERGLAYRAKAAVNWCPSCQTVLANEQAEGGECWRCHSKVEERELDQWFLRITHYQDELLDDMEQLKTWPDRVLVQQRNWVGRSKGAEVDFPVEGAAPIRIFTTRVDTIYGATFMVLAPEHPRVDGLIAGTPEEAGAREVLLRLRGQDRRARQANLLALRREGDVWTITHGAEVTRLKDMKGVAYLAELLAHPGQEFHALDLGGAGDLRTGDSGEMLDGEARRAYTARIRDLREELEEAEGFHDVGRTARLREEMEMLAGE